MTDKMKIYFCGSIRGGREQQALYARLVERMKALGCTVLTEHIASPALTNRGGDGEDSQIYRRDTAWLRECDLVIAECTQPSIGVGYELAYAEALQKPVHVFFGGEEGRLSAMIAGNPYFRIHVYHSEDELFARMGDVLR